MAAAVSTLNEMDINALVSTFNARPCESVCALLLAGDYVCLEIKVIPHYLGTTYSGRIPILMVIRLENPFDHAS